MNELSEQNNGLIVPSRTSGPLSYQNWLAFKKDAPWRYIQEYPLFSDANISGDNPKNMGPYAFLNTVADRDSVDTIVGIVMRVAMHLDLSPRIDGYMDRTEESAYHGGGMNDEIAALLSLCMGVRFRPGKCIRDFYPRAVDQKGHPRSFDPHSMPFVRRHGQQLIVPSAAGPACLNEKTTILVRYADMTPENATVLVKVARSYQEAMWLAEIQPELTWLMLVQAVETAANHWSNETTTSLQRVQDWGPGADLLKYLDSQNLKTSQIEEIARIIGPYVGTVRKFREFLMEYLPQPCSSRPPEIAQVDWSTEGMKKVLDRVYKCRSTAVHNGQPFPSIMCEAPMKLDGGYEERPTCSAAQVYGATWTGEDIPILLHTFEFIVREALLTWWQWMLPSQPKNLSLKEIAL